MCDKNTGRGRLSPFDTPEFIEITVSVENGLISGAEFTCTDDEYVRCCASAVCSVMLEKPFADCMQMNGNAVIYNTEKDLPRDKLYLASMAVMAAKLAVSDYAKKNGIPLEGGVCHCGD